LPVFFSWITSPWSEIENVFQKFVSIFAIYINKTPQNYFSPFPTKKWLFDAYWNIYFLFRILKFIYSEKATKFSEIFTLLWTMCTVVNSKVKISQNFVAFSEYMNFEKRLHNYWEKFVISLTVYLFVWYVPIVFWTLSKLTSAKIGKEG
jgi:hypothetical protein